ncbi:juvenile hormone esterase-like [Thrips palmi]|uniref:Carboxylic ester hydrolase n=1 Tax=Thrips palmi TaxID=161013 RepID=A0A6P9AIB4_THRPL|nr:juvenile hormone esterase-like [Thrips palmi]XP_034255176.1 juvenile hormone esterase-like [Thrips palmi]XP_034255177.1 juvenile hormone esterase-like [Thrips palmi]
MGFGWSAPVPEVEVKTGHLRGKVGLTPKGVRYHAFQGIPYGKPPVGELRFKAPQPAEPWTGVRNATAEGNPCYQAPMPLEAPGGMSLKTVYGLLKNLPALANRYMVSKKQSEDCLFLNVYTPVCGPAAPAHVWRPGGGQVHAAPETKEAANALRPVIFWVHGGAFKFGDGNADMLSPELFLEKDVLVVTINYRLGPFGFLTLGTEDAPGNAGLKDQALALRWTHENIRAFGGDPSAITIYGESAGGASVHHLALSPTCKGLFRGIIASSGLAISHWATSGKENAVASARGLAKELGVPGSTPEELLKGLRAVDPVVLNAAAGTMTPVMTSMTDELMWLPVVEEEHPGAFQTEDPLSLVRAGRFSDVPLMTGVCSAEGLVWVLLGKIHDDRTYKSINEMEYYFLPPDLREALSPEQRDKCVQDILDEYTGGKPFSQESVGGFIELFGDVFFKTRLVNLARDHTKAAAGAGFTNAPMFVYHFDFVGRYNCLKWFTKSKMGKTMTPVKGAAHGDDLWYVSNIRVFPLPSLEATSREEVCRERMVTFWTNFAKTGNPTPAGSDEKLPIKWTPCSETSMPFMDIGSDLELKTGAPLYPRQAFWEGLYQKYMGKPLTP